MRSISGAASTSSVPYDAVIVRFGGEIGVKSSPVRLRYERLVVRHVRRALKARGIAFTSLEYSFGRLYVRSPEAGEAARAIARVFGVSSASPALSTSSDLESIAQTGLELARAFLSPGESFAVRCRRVGEHPYTSMDVCRLLGERILSELGHRGLRVNLDEPDKEICVEVREDKAFLFAETYPGPGGFPLGSQGRLIGLLSSGMDSPVACWLAMRRGCVVIPVHFDLRPFSDDAAVEKAVELARVLADWSIGLMRRMYLVPHGEVLAEIREKCPEPLTCVLCKRFMLRAAARLAELSGADGILTGDSVGEQASQTLRNLRAIDEAAGGLLVVRPLMCFDKTEVFELARRIGTYDISARPDAGCEAAPRKPTTAADIGAVLEAEEALDVEGLVERALSAIKEIRLKWPAEEA